MRSAAIDLGGKLLRELAQAGMPRHAWPVQIVKGVLRQCQPIEQPVISAQTRDQIKVHADDNTVYLFNFTTCDFRARMFSSSTPKLKAMATYA